MNDRLPQQPAETTAAQVTSHEWPSLPTETEIYILPDGRVVIADLPVELLTLVAQLGQVLPCRFDPESARTSL